MCSREFILTMSADPCRVECHSLHDSHAQTAFRCSLYVLFLCKMLSTVAWSIFFLEGLSTCKSKETESNNRSVMPLDVLGRTRATMPGTAGTLSYTERYG